MIALFVAGLRIASLAGEKSVKAPPRRQDARNEAPWGENKLSTRRNTIGMELALVPAGKFLMGTLRTDDEDDEYERAVDVTLTRAFYLGRTEVTQAQWRVVMETTPWKAKPLILEGDDYPATHVSWDDAQEFCRKLSAKDKQKYRLPTEAEWECACRAGTLTQFVSGKDATSLDEYAWFSANALEANERYPHRVAQKKPNAFGLYDMHGNVWEWCEDVYHWELPGGADPLVTVGGTPRVDRGGGWASDANYCRSAARFCNVPWRGDKVLGFRVALTVDATPTAVKQSKAKPKLKAKPPPPARAK